MLGKTGHAPMYIKVFCVPWFTSIRKKTSIKNLEDLTFYCKISKGPMDHTVIGKKFASCPEAERIGGAQSTSVILKSQERYWSKIFLQNTHALTGTR